MFVFTFLIGRVITESGEVADVSHTGVWERKKEHFFFWAFVEQIHSFLLFS